MKLITGGAGFIGSHLVGHLLTKGEKVVVLDNFNHFYNVDWKWQNVREIQEDMEREKIPAEHLTVVKGDIRDKLKLIEIFNDNPIQCVVHLAAMPGVRPSMLNPLEYTDVNVLGTVNLLEMCRKHEIKEFIFASSSSVYGNSSNVPFAESDLVDYPISPYAATKKAGELLCHTYHHLYDFNVACLRFFTVYGPRQRPDLAIYKFTDLISEEKELPFYGDGSTARDYTYIDDIVDGVVKSMDWMTSPTGKPRYEIFNLGGATTITLRSMVIALQQAIGKPARLRKLPLQPGDILKTHADISKAKTMLGYNPGTSFEKGISRFVAWYKERRLHHV